MRPPGRPSRCETAASHGRAPEAHQAHRPRAAPCGGIPSHRPPPHACLFKQTLCHWYQRGDRGGETTTAPMGRITGGI
jgi:hypothetical protein